VSGCSGPSTLRTYGDAFDGLDLTPHECDFYLILSGSRRAGSEVAPLRWYIANVYVLNAHLLRAELERRGVRIGIATSLRVSDLRRAEIYPTSGSDSLLTLTESQRQLLSLFA
jgi:hypothetical protein